MKKNVLKDMKEIILCLIIYSALLKDTTHKLISQEYVVHKYDTI